MTQSERIPPRQPLEPPEEERLLPFPFGRGGGRIAAKTLFLEQLSDILCEGFFIVIALSSSAVESKHDLSLQCCWHAVLSRVGRRGMLCAKGSSAQI